jgi:hypothetical protein
MGLDQYAIIARKHEKNTDFDVYWMREKISDSVFRANVVSIVEWRKHPYLQGWMENLFKKKADAQGFEGMVMPGGMYTDVTLNAMTPEGVEGFELDKEFKKKMKEITEEVRKQFKAMVEDAAPERIFNCQPLRLTLSDLEQLEEAVNRGELPKSSGFFWGDDSSEFYKEQDLQFIKDARSSIINGNEVYYNSSW